MTNIKVLTVLFFLYTLINGAVLKRGSSSKEKFLVSSLPGLFENIQDDDTPTIFLGQLELFQENSTYYYFQKYSDPKNKYKSKGKTIFWFNGGPGCLSMDGALMEAGPFRINKEGKVVYNHGSWHKAADVVFVDQPAGTGFSYSLQYDHTLVGVAHHYLRFLEKFFELFPEDRDNDIYLAGESYAGQYIPYVAERLFRYNEREVPNSNGEKKPFNVKGLLIGNGWIDPYIQSLAYLPFSVQAGVISLKNPGFNDILKQHERCQNLINKIKANEVDPSKANKLVNQECEVILNMILYSSLDQEASADQQCVNMYDYSLRDSYPSCGMNWPPDLEYVKPFLNNDDNLDSLNVISERKWSECLGRVGRYLTNEGIPPGIQLFPHLLDRIPIVLFHGNRDIICNYIGAESMIKELTWGGKQGFSEDLTVYDWKYNNSTVGYIKSERNLTFVNVFDASHMVPFDNAEVSRSIIDLVLEKYDLKMEDDKHVLETYPLGQWKAADNNKGTDNEESSSPSGVPQADDSDSDSDEETPNKTENEDSSSKKVIRLIQLAVIGILFWGAYILYKSYKSKPSSIIKSRPSSGGKKKNVQWADQLSGPVIDEDNLAGEGSNNNSNFLSKAYNKITGNNNGKGTYEPTPTEDIEMGPASSGPPPEHFKIESDDEEEVHQPLQLESPATESKD